MKADIPLIDIRPDHWEIVQAILQKHVPQYEVWAFGSRATWKAKEYSDLDLAIISDQPLSLDVSASLSDDFSESDLPWKVDVVDWATTSPSFRKIIERDRVVVIAKKKLEPESNVLGGVCAIVMGQSPSGEMCNTTGVGVPLLNGPTEYGAYHPLPVQFTTQARKYAREGDLLFCVRGSTTGRMNWADREYAIGRGVAAIRHKLSLELQPLVRAVIEYNLPELLAQATGSTFPNVSSGQLSSLSWPNLQQSEQRAIAHILGTLDDKIELNRRMNQTLEAMASTLFKAWFVDFEPVRAKIEGRWKKGQSLPGLPAHLYDLFPDKLVDSELGEIPEGWSVGSFKNCCERVESGGTPSRSESKFWGGDIPWLTSGEVRDIIIISTREKITNEGLNASNAKLWPAMTTVVAMYGATAGQVCLIAKKMAANQACCALIPYAEFRTFIFLAAKNSIMQLADKASGSAQQNLNKSLVQNHSHIIPTKSVALSFEQLSYDFLQKWIENDSQNRYLSWLRDTLLPKLISGELRVPDVVEKITEGISE